jgi:hypothetical protein
MIAALLAYTSAGARFSPQKAAGFNHGVLTTVAGAEPICVGTPCILNCVGISSNKETTKSFTQQIRPSIQATARARSTRNKFMGNYYGVVTTVTDTGPHCTSVSVGSCIRKDSQFSKFPANQVKSFCHHQVPESTSVSPVAKTSAVKRYVTGESTGASSVVEWGSYPARLRTVTVARPCAEVKE